MLSNALVVTTIPVTDLGRAKAFYVDVLGLTTIMETPFAVRLRGGNGTQISLSTSAGRSSGATRSPTSRSRTSRPRSRISARGAVFEEYTEGPLVTTNSIAPIGPARGAWLRDPDGNVLGLREGPVPA